VTTPITFTSINRAASTDSTDMPHVLGDPADVNWKGTAERVNDNFAAITAWCTAQTNAINAMKIPAARLSGAGVLTPATNWTLTDGYAYARTLAFGTVLLVFLDFQLIYTGVAERPTGGLAAQNIATLVASLRPTISTYYRIPGSYYTHGTTYADFLVGCDVAVTTSGQIAYQSPSTVAAPGEAPTRISASIRYFTGSS
jgi:hypothetical protein